MELDPTGKEVPYFVIFFITTLTTKLGKNRKMENFLHNVSI